MKRTFPRGGAVGDPPPEVVHGLSRDTLRTGEAVTFHWSAPKGRGLLTNFRLLLLGHPSPVHRAVLGSVNLEEVHPLAVEQIDNGLTGDYLTMAEHGRGSWSGDTMRGICLSAPNETDRDPNRGVLVNAIVVCLGNAPQCAEIQKRVDDARTTRCLALYGRLLPYPTGATVSQSEGADQEGSEGVAPSSGSAATTAGTPVLLFIAGAPFQHGV